MKIYKTDERFMRFCRFMYDENYEERLEHGQIPYATAEEYIEKNLDWLQNQYRIEAKRSDESWARSIYLS
tara:strand:- start:1377 stop:1586 length:210 start_codon:yes stop_codon:yes gene_type:complete